MAYKRLDFTELLKNKKTKTISMEESLKDITPIQWSKEVREGKKTVVISK